MAVDTEPQDESWQEQADLDGTVVDSAEGSEVTVDEEVEKVEDVNELLNKASYPEPFMTQEQIKRGGSLLYLVGKSL